MLLLIYHTEINKFNRVKNFNNLKSTLLQPLQNRFQIYLHKEEALSEIWHIKHLVFLKIQNHNNNHFKHLQYLLNQCLHNQCLLIQFFLNQCILIQHREIHFTIPYQQGQYKVDIDIHLNNQIIIFFRSQSFFILILNIILLDLNIYLKYLLIIYRSIHITSKNKK